MAQSVDRVACWGALYCGDFCDHWVGTWQDPTWSRNGRDSGKIRIQYSVYHGYRGVRWISPGQPTKVWAIIAGIAQGAAGGPNTYDDCSGGDAMGITASGTAELIQWANNPYGTLNYDIGMDWGWSSHAFTFQGDLGYYPASYTLGNNFKILPPKNLSGSVSTKTPRKITASCSVGSWSDNANITGTPYTGDGGRNWNFRAQIKVGSTVVYEITKNTGETKNASFTFDDLNKLNNIPLDTNVTMHFTCSNNYQQTIDYDVTFQIQGIGYVVKSGSVKKIRYMEIIEDRGDTVVRKYSTGRPRRIVG